MKHINLYPFIMVAIIGTFFMPNNASAQRANSLYFLERTPFHNQWNPAMTPENTGFGIGVSNISISAHSDLAYSDLFTPSADGSEFHSLLDEEFDKEALIAKLGALSSININSNIDILNIGIRFKKGYLTIHSGITLDAGLGVPKDLFKMFLLGMDENAASTVFNMTELNINSMAYAKYGIGYSTKIGKMFTVGVNANYLQGITDMRMGFDNLTVTASDAEWNAVSNGYVQMAAPDFVKFKYDQDGYLNGIDTEDRSGSGLPKTGKGFSMDLGITAKPLPYLTLSAALIDLGSIKWDASCIQRAESNGTYTFDGVVINDNEDISFDESSETFKEMAHFSQDNNVTGYSSKLTTKLNIGAEAGILNNHITFGLLSQTGFATEGNYQDFMFSANLKPSKIIQGALTYSRLHGNISAFGAAVNAKLLFFNLFAAGDIIPMKYSEEMIPKNSKYLNFQFGLNMMF
ncbi:MAG: DUF5723 family protein [Bacteroidales bacterium]|nr:DUF5723 family protein [Bacteroidales bacterium]